jgi:hypothetical protein
MLHSLIVGGVRDATGKYTRWSGEEGFNPGLLRINKPLFFLCNVNKSIEFIPKRNALSDYTAMMYDAG